MDIEGHKGGSSSSSRTPVEAPDSLASIAYARILDLTTEGEIEGLVNGNASIFLNETPLETDGVLNFTGVTVYERKGTQAQPYIPGFPSVENDITVGVELKAAVPFVRAITNNQLSAIRVRFQVPRLVTQNASNGDTTGARVDYRIELKVGDGAYQVALASAFDGKTTSTYERSHRIELPPSASGWTLRITKNTPDSISSLLVNTVNISALTEIIDAKFRYPNSALIGLTFDASQFTSLPNRAYHLRGMRIKVPSNYNPVTRAYSGVWDGTFQVAYSNNPAWCYYDILLNDRYGLGHMVKSYQVDRYELYRIAQYCDQMVSDGKGGTEPRFTCNLYLQSQAAALKVLQDMAAIFRGMSYWGASSVYSSADMPEDPTYTYTNANVIDGRFDYTGSKRADRYSVVLVSWNDPDDFYRAKVEYVEDRESLALFGHRQMNLTAIGCSSQAQAQRLGRWTLLTNKLETDTVNFIVSLDGTLVRPGKVVRVADNKRAGRRIGGRIRDQTINSVILDANVDVFAGDRVTVTLPNGKTETRIAKGVGKPISWDSTGITWDNGQVTLDTTSYSTSVQMVEVTQNFSDIPVLQSIWAVESDSLAAQQFRILSIAEDFGGDRMQFKVTATKHVSGKFDAIDYNTRIDAPPITVLNPSVQAAPANIRLSSDYLVNQGNILTTMTIVWDGAPNAVAYEVQWKMNNGTWIVAGRTGSTRMEVQGILAGRYLARVRAMNSLDLSSVWANSIEYSLESKTQPPPALAFFATDTLVFSIGLRWGFPAGFDAQATQRTEVWYSTSNVFANAVKQGDYSYPTTNTLMMGLNAGAKFYFWARLVDKAGNFGPFTGPVEGSSSTDASVILEYLKGQITKTLLAQSLLAYIAPAEDLGALDSRVSQVVLQQNDQNKALTQQINTAQSQASNGVAIAQQAQETAADINGDLSAMSTIKTQITANGRTYIAGIGVGVENSQGVIESQVLVAASRFAVLDPNGAALLLPFVIQGGQVFIDQALIGTAWITNAKIADAAITNAKIGDAQITTAKIQDLAVDTLKIKGNAITVPVGVFSGSSDVSLTVTLDGNYPVFIQASLTQVYFAQMVLQRNGQNLWTEQPTNSTLASRGIMDYPGPGTHTYRFYSADSRNTNGTSLIVLVCKR
jgi:predicted phage tail protein